MASLPQDLYPDVELALPPLTPPIRKKRLVLSMGNHDEDSVWLARSTPGLSGRSADTIRRRHESYNLSGSVFLVTS
jgi:hypothetical protein